MNVRKFSCSCIVRRSLLLLSFFNTRTLPQCCFILAFRNDFGLCYIQSRIKENKWRNKSLSFLSVKHNGVINISRSKRTLEVHHITEFLRVEIQKGCSHNALPIIEGSSSLHASFPIYLGSAKEDCCEWCEDLKVTTGICQTAVILWSQNSGIWKASLQIIECNAQDRGMAS